MSKSWSNHNVIRNQSLVDTRPSSESFCLGVVDRHSFTKVSQQRPSLTLSFTATAVTTAIAAADDQNRSALR